MPLRWLLSAGDERWRAKAYERVLDHMLQKKCVALGGDDSSEVWTAIPPLIARAVKGLEGIGWGIQVKALSGSVVVDRDEGDESGLIEGCQIGFAWQDPSHAAGGVLDATLLPGGVRITVEGGCAD